jgi:GNAT superfamily N-acetyltransferase
MDLDTIPASNYPLPDLAKFLNRGFEEYFVPIQFSTTTFLDMLRKDGIDLTTSRILIAEDQPCGIALIARRGWSSRLAAMGISKESRGKGAGFWFMDGLINEARGRGDREMVLEVIEQNEPALQLYRKSGFETVRRLTGFIRKSAKESVRSNLHEMDLREMGRLVSQYGLSDLPWQLSGECIVQMTPPARAYRKGRAYIAISNPNAEDIVIWSLLVEQDARRNGFGADMLRSVMTDHAGKTWHVPAIFPEELGKVFEKAGFEREELSQWQMKLSL